MPSHAVGGWAAGEGVHEPGLLGESVGGTLGSLVDGELVLMGRRWCSFSVECEGLEGDDEEEGGEGDGVGEC